MADTNTPSTRLERIDAALISLEQGVQTIVESGGIIQAALRTTGSSPQFDAMRLTKSQNLAEKEMRNFRNVIQSVETDEARMAEFEEKIRSLELERDNANKARDDAQEARNDMQVARDQALKAKEECESALGQSRVEVTRLKQELANRLPPPPLFPRSTSMSTIRSAEEAEFSPHQPRANPFAVHRTLTASQSVETGLAQLDMDTEMTVDTPSAGRRGSRVMSQTPMATPSRSSGKEVQDTQKVLDRMSPTPNSPTGAWDSFMADWHHIMRYATPEKQLGLCDSAVTLGVSICFVSKLRQVGNVMRKGKDDKKAGCPQCAKNAKYQCCWLEKTAEDKFVVHFRT